MARRKKTRACPSCGANFRKGKIVLRLTLAGSLRQTVCQSCANLATPVLASDAPNRCENCGRNHARFCAGCVGKVIDQQLGLKVAEALAKRGVDVLEEEYRRNPWKDDER